ncbi:NAD(P)/FAD-dependent oxidoreductase [Rhodoligotrophos defluvii]|uniref:NAD(P)/FAD-dependent oxidoreductase n=1 Tax=Rhodoligotrophos defluvii TaxID=2561934 RepID=UPI0010C94DB1|nr:FAD-dependent oxidoreductase [Rhodoligotrophos defluvii]
MAHRIAVVGGGFAGLWGAASAARARARFAVPEAELEIVLVSPGPFHVIRVRCYEADLEPVRVPLDDVLSPIGVRRVQARVTGIDATARSLTLEGGAGAITGLEYDRLLLASGSELVRPAIPMGQQTFDVDSYEGARRLAGHLAALAEKPRNEAACTAVVIGGGLVGIEIACELPGRLRSALGADAAVRVVLVDRGDIGADMGEGRGIILDALAALRIESRPSARVTAIDQTGVALDSGEHIATATVVFATGMRASPLTEGFGVTRDRLGRLPVDRFLMVEGVESVYAAGDCAQVQTDDLGHVSVMSCQHARPMGRLAGHNMVCDLTGRLAERVPFTAPDYVTVLDLGPYGALYTSGWERGTVVAKGAEAKATKQTINGMRIYPPRPATRGAIFAAAAPVIQSRPSVKTSG